MTKKKQMMIKKMDDLHFNKKKKKTNANHCLTKKNLHLKI